MDTDPESSNFVDPDTINLDPSLVLYLFYTTLTHGALCVKEWFSNPMTGMVEGNSEYNEGLIKR